MHRELSVLHESSELESLSAEPNLPRGHDCRSVRAFRCTKFPPGGRQRSMLSEVAGDRQLDLGDQPPPPALNIHSCHDVICLGEVNSAASSDKAPTQPKPQTCRHRGTGREQGTHPEQGDGLGRGDPRGGHYRTRDTLFLRLALRVTVSAACLFACSKPCAWLHRGVWCVNCVCLDKLL